MERVEKYGMFEIKLSGCGNAASLPRARFTLGDDVCEIRGFCENEKDATIRFMPRSEGDWRYEASWGDLKTEGGFACVPNTGVNHGPVVTGGHHFRYADGSAYIPMGTTCYAWVHQGAALAQKTLETLSTAPFNKLRMCVFPKGMVFNRNDPEWYPFEKKSGGGWDVQKPVPAFWENLENRIADLAALGVEADLILFHPYDRWGFSSLTREENLIYLDYCVRRLAAHRNIWWSLANEYDLTFSKTNDDWACFGEKIAASDPYAHLTSIHNWVEPYPKSEWMSHVSLQHSDMTAAFRLRVQYDLPLMVDELGYEGDIDPDWGNNSGFEIMNRMWTAVAFGCYPTHGETFFREDEVLWWAKGGALYGEAPERIRFLRDFLASLPGPMEPLCAPVLSDPFAMTHDEAHAAIVRMIWERTKSEKGREVLIGESIKPIGANPDYRLIYLQRHCRGKLDLKLPESGRYDVEVIDIWRMTREAALTGASGATTVPLPGREGIAVLVTRREGEKLA